MERHKSGLIIVIGALVLMGLLSAGNVRLWGRNGSGHEPDHDSAAVLSFALELEGQEVEHFSQCTGLGSRNAMETTVVATEEGLQVRKAPGPLERTTIVLKDRQLSGSTVWEWRQAMERGDLERAIRNGAIRVYDRHTGELEARWEFKAGWAACLTLSGRGEELAIVHQGFIRNQPRPPRTR